MLYMIVNHQEDSGLKILYLKFFNLNFKICYAFAVYAHLKTLQWYQSRPCLVQSYIRNIYVMHIMIHAIKLFISLIMLSYDDMK